MGRPPLGGQRGPPNAPSPGGEELVRRAQPEGSAVTIVRVGRPIGNSKSGESRSNASAPHTSPDQARDQHRHARTGPAWHSRHPTSGTSGRVGSVAAPVGPRRRGADLCRHAVSTRRRAPVDPDVAGTRVAPGEPTCGRRSPRAPRAPHCGGPSRHRGWAGPTTPPGPVADLRPQDPTGSGAGPCRRGEGRRTEHGELSTGNRARRGGRSRGHTTTAPLGEGVPSSGEPTG